MENNTSTPANGSGSEPYVGMPIYLDDSFFDFMNEDVESECPMPYDMDDEMNEMMPGSCPTAPGNCPMMPGNNQMAPGTCPTAPGKCPMNSGTCPTAPGNCPMTPGTCPTAPGNCPMTPATCPTAPGNNQMAPDNCRMMPENNQMTPQMGSGGGQMPQMGNEGSMMPMDCANGCPLAMAYVPWQVWNDTYDMEQGFIVGTIFPELDLPFLGGAVK